MDDEEISNKEDKNNINYDEDDWNDIDDNKPSLTEEDKKFNNINKKENFEILKKKRNKSLDKTDIEYDSKRKEIINFCPNLIELKNDDFKIIKNTLNENIIPKNNNKCIIVNKNISSNENEDNLEKFEYSSSEEEIIKLQQIEDKISLNIIII
jgi:hypothetical protein